MRRIFSHLFTVRATHDAVLIIAIDKSFKSSNWTYGTRHA
jgi:hypothetical protein